MVRHFICLSRGLQFVRLGEHCRPRPDVASCSVWSDPICSEMCIFCKIDKIMLAKSETKVHEDIIFGEMYLEYGPRSDVALHIVGNIELKKFDTFQFRL